MSSKNLLISRLKDQRSRIQGMLSPGRKQGQSGHPLNASLSPVAPDLAGRKFQVAAKKMRTLDADKIGQILSSGLTSLSTDIHSKFEDIQKIIHLHPGASARNIWSSVETPLPEPQAARQETPDDPGVMRSGSIIRKMSILPRPGQSLESFRNQVQDQPASSKPQLEKKPVITKNTRRFSQVQEVTPGQKLVPPEMPAVPLKADETQPPRVKTSDTPGSATIQPQADASVPVVDRLVITPRREKPVPGSSKTTGSPVPPAEPEQKKSPLEMPLRKEPRILEPAASTVQRTPPEVKTQPSDATQEGIVIEKKEEIRVPEARTRQTPGSRSPVQGEQILKALPVLKKAPLQAELKKALPLKRTTEQTPKPVARPGIKPTIDAPAPKAPPRPVIQRATDEDLPAATPVQPSVQPVKLAPAPSASVPESPAPSASVPESPAPAEPETVKPEMPLRQKINYRQNAPHALRVIAPDQMKPLSLPSLIERKETPLLTRTRQLPAVRDGSPAQQEARFSLNKSQPVSSASLPGSLPKVIPDQVDSQPSTARDLAPIPMPLVSPVPAWIPKSESQPATAPVQPLLEKLPPKRTGVRKTNNTIQRTWEGHTPPSQSASGNSEPAAKAGSEPIDLETLAENVFPYVKRILEIEVDRSSGRSR